MEATSTARFPLLPWIWTAAMLAASIAVLTAGPDGGDDTALAWVAHALWLALPTLYAGLGAVIATRRPGNRVAWLFMLMALFPLLDASTDAWFDGRPSSPGLLDYLGLYWDNTGFLVALIIPILLLLFWFPTGRFLNGRWSWAGWVAGVVAAIVLFVGVFSAELGRFVEDWTVHNPIGFLPFSGLEESGALQIPLGVGLLSLLAGGVLSLVVRYRRSDDLVKKQIRWAAYPLVPLVILLAGVVLLDQWDNPALLVVGYVSLVLVPVVIAATIVRYDFDVGDIYPRLTIRG